jgi:hypothetical protein
VQAIAGRQRIEPACWLSATAAAPGPDGGFRGGLPGRNLEVRKRRPQIGEHLKHALGTVVGLQVRERSLQDGDVVEVEIEGIGTLRNPVAEV